MALTRRATVTGIAAALSLPWVRPSYAAAGSVNIYSWAEYIGETTLADFEAETGITPIDDTDSSPCTLRALYVGLGRFCL